jgi:predicted nucleic acid-binding protein
VGRSQRYEGSKRLGKKNAQAAVLLTLIFDSDVVIWMLRKKAQALRFARSLEPGECNISVVSYLEILRGCRDGEEVKALSEFIGEWFSDIVPVRPEICISAVSLMRKFALSHRPGVDDTLIAATALNRGEPLATGNIKHFKFIPGLVLRKFQL